MLHVLFVDVCEDGKDLSCINLGKLDGQLAYSPNQGGQGLIATILENKVEVFLVLKCIIKIRVTT